MMKVHYSRKQVWEKVWGKGGISPIAFAFKKKCGGKHTATIERNSIMKIIKFKK
jgi:hypothetical protein